MSKMIQIRNVPDRLHRKLKSRAAMAGMSLSDYLLEEVRSLADLPTPEEMVERLGARAPVEPEESLAESVRREREDR